MQSHPSPCAHVCTTLPPGNLPMRERFPELDLPTRLTYESDCGRIRRSYTRVFDELHWVPVGTWYCFEERTDQTGQKWTKQSLGAHYVVDDFGFLALGGKGGAA